MRENALKITLLRSGEFGFVLKHEMKVKRAAEEVRSGRREVRNTRKRGRVGEGETIRLGCIEAV